MSMFCYQCQEASKGIGCSVVGVCGKQPSTAKLQDLLVYTAKGISILYELGKECGADFSEAHKYVFQSLFVTITNANFDDQAIARKITDGLVLRERLVKQLTAEGVEIPHRLHPSATWYVDENGYEQYASAISILDQEPDEDKRSLKELLVYGLKGMAAYAEHAHNLGYANDELFAFMHRALAFSASDNATVDELVAIVLECGKFGVDVMALLDTAHTDTFGHPEITEVNLGVRKNPGILISGHDLKDMEDLLKQTEGTGVDVYTHSEMLPAHYYPAFKKFDHFVGNYGNAWWQQQAEFEQFNGPVIFTTNCIVPPKDSYKNRIYTTGASGFDGCKYIPERQDGGQKDFSEIIAHAKKCKPPVELETGTIVGGFAHNQVVALADKVVEAVQSGAIKKFFVMAGCDGRMKTRNYYTEFAEALPNDSVILTAGCAKYRYNKLQLGDIGGIPRVLDAGQCNDSYSLAVIALKLKEVFNLTDINDLPIVYNIAWYEQKAVIVLLALLHLGVKNIHLGPTLPAFLSPNVADVLVQNFGIASISSVEKDLEVFMA